MNTPDAKPCGAWWQSIKLFDWKAALVALSFLSGVFVLWADQHNDARYVRLSRYEDDERRLQEALRELKDGQKQILTHLLNQKK